MALLEDALERISLLMGERFVHFIGNSQNVSHLKCALMHDKTSNVNFTQSYQSILCTLLLKSQTFFVRPARNLISLGRCPSSHDLSLTLGTKSMCYIMHIQCMQMECCEDIDQETQGFTPS